MIPVDLMIKEGRMLFLKQYVLCQKKKKSGSQCQKGKERTTDTMISSQCEAGTTERSWHCALGEKAVVK